jgi:hypothetical protein
MTTDLRPSQIATINHINGRPGKVSTAAVGFQMAAELEAAGMITVKAGKCYPTAAAAIYGAPSKAEVAESRMHAHAAVMGRYAVMH